jgi:hypothetical protein
MRQRLYGSHYGYRWVNMRPCPATPSRRPTCFADQKRDVRQEYYTTGFGEMTAHTAVGYICPYNPEVV